MAIEQRISGISENGIHGTQRGLGRAEAIMMINTKLSLELRMNDFNNSPWESRREAELYFRCGQRGLHAVHDVSYCWHLKKNGSKRREYF